MSNRIILFGAGKECIKAINAIGKDNIEFIYDNDPSKDGTFIHGIPVIRFNKKAVVNKPVYITPVGQSALDIRNQMTECGIACLSSGDIRRMLWKPNKNIQKYKGIHSGERCFLIGTGPSLSIDDLEMLRKKKEFCFGANRIFKMFADTLWRPDIYFIIDYKVIMTYIEEFYEIESTIDCFISDIRDTPYASQIDVDRFGNSFDNIFHLYCQDDIYTTDTVEFSDRPDIYIAEGMTVIYGMIQLACYMGFSEMYLLGVDFNYSDASGNDKDALDHCCKNYINPGEIVNPPRPQINLKAFESAKEYGKKNGVRVFNATRGGKLEVFERVDLDHILEDGDE